VRSLAAALVAAALLAGCGGSGDELTVSAASSLKGAFTALGGARFSFAGSDQLAAQLRQGVKPDVFAAANTTLPDALFADGLVEKPVVFAANRLVLAVPAEDARVASLADLETPGVTLAVGSANAPVGRYTREVLSRLGPGPSRRIRANVRSSEPDVKGVVGKLTQGAVDASFVYATDVAATAGALRAIELPARLEPAVRYGAAVVRDAEHRGAARAFVDGLRSGDGRRELEQAGFTIP